MRKATSLHNQAMDFADKAVFERLHGNESNAQEFFQKAFEKERAAAIQVAAKVDFEPTRSVLHRSAASLALECGQMREAERLITCGLSGNPPQDIADELWDLLREFDFRRHLILKGIKLEPNQLQFTLKGRAVGAGFASSTVFIERINAIDTMVGRTAERLANVPFKERYAPGKAIKREVELFISPPRKSSFAVSLQVGLHEQLSAPWRDIAPQVVSEVLDCLDLLERADIEELRKKIPDPPYFRSFVGLARTLAPDGTEVNSVHLTNAKQNVVLKKPKRHLAKANILPGDEDIGIEEKLETFEGVLRFADETKEGRGEIKLIDAKGKKHKIRVPPGMMSDIVKPLWGCRVVVSGYKKATLINLVDIEEISE